MHTETSIIMHAPLDKVFAAAANLELWVKILPHYRWIRFIERTSSYSIVKMAAKRGWIPIQWTSRHEVDPTAKQIRFQHLKAFTKGMNVVWSFTQKNDGVEVCIRHDLILELPLVGKFIADKIIGKFFIEYVATRTLRYMKQFVERNYGT
jgi:ribosome-associated toxin RatA of RatAB toxin-antitoxin module